MTRLISLGLILHPHILSAQSERPIMTAPKRLNLDRNLVSWIFNNINIDNLFCVFEQLEAIGA